MLTILFFKKMKAILVKRFYLNFVIKCILNYLGMPNKTVMLKVVSATFLLVCFLSLNESTCQTGKDVFLFHFKSSFRSQENQILEFYILKFHDVIKCLSIKQEIRFTE